MTEIIMTAHVTDDRMDRMVKIATTIGFGKPIVQKFQRNGNRAQLTTTGVILIKAPDEEVLITAFVGNTNKVKWLLNGRMNNEMKRIVKRNYELGLVGV